MNPHLLDVQQLEAQLQVFDTVLQADTTACMTGIGSIQFPEVDLSDPEQIFQTLHATAVEYECFSPFLSVLQGLLAIPSFDTLGKQQVPYLLYDFICVYIYVYFYI